MLYRQERSFGVETLLRIKTCFLFLACALDFSHDNLCLALAIIITCRWKLTSWDDRWGPAAVGEPDLAVVNLGSGRKGPARGNVLREPVLGAELDAALVQAVQIDARHAILEDGEKHNKLSILVLRPKSNRRLSSSRNS